MAGCYGSSREDRHFEAMCDNYTDYYTPICAECGNDWNTDLDGDIDSDDDICVECRMEEFKAGFLKLARRFAELGEKVDHHKSYRDTGIISIQARYTDAKGANLIGSNYMQILIGYGETYPNFELYSIDVFYFHYKDGTSKMTIEIDEGLNEEDLEKMMDYGWKLFRELKQTK